MNGKVCGGVLLVVGTSIGGGMLALPISTASSMGFGHSACYLIASWLVMTAGAFLVLEVNLYLAPGTNMVSMARQTLGRAGEIITWLAYLVLLYTLLSAYISGSSDVLQHDLGLGGWLLPRSFAAVIFLLIFGGIVYGGIRLVDLTNRGLMFFKLGVFALLVMMIAPKIHPERLLDRHASPYPTGIMTLITSFGFATIIPSLRAYFDTDLKQLRMVLLVGSLIPLVCYIAWDAVLMGTIPHDGFASIERSANATTALISQLSLETQSAGITSLFNAFSAVSFLTSFLSVSIGLMDFLADGCGLQKRGLQGQALLLLTFGPPLAVVLFYPGAYLSAFRFAGICCVVLLLLLPTLMAYRGRYGCQIANNRQLPGGRWLLAILVACGIGLLYLAV